MLGIYCRISVEKEEGADRSINDQKQSGIELAKEQGLDYEIYIDEGLSGNLPKIEQRPRLSNLVDDIIEGKITSVYSYDQSRLERNPQIRFLLNNIFRENQIQLYTSTGITDLNDMESEMLGDMVSIMNQYYVKLTKKKIKSVLHRNAKEGKVHSSIYPYGYTKGENNYLVIDEEEKEIVERIYNDSLKGIGTNKIAENFNAENIPTRYNKIGVGVIKTKNKYTGEITTTKKSDIKWSGNSVRGIIKNTIYKGERKFGGETYVSPVLIETDFWQKVNDNLSKNRNNSGKKVDHKYLLKGLLECGVCGRNMYGRTRENKKDHYYMCSSKRHKELNCGNRSVNIDFIERFIWEVVFDDAYEDEEFETEEKYELKIEKLHNEKQALESKMLSFDESIKHINKLVIDKFLNIDEGLRNKKSYQSKLDEVKTELKNLNEELSYEEEAKNLRETVEIDIEKTKVNTPFNKKRELIFKYISRAYIRYDKNIKYYYLTVSFRTKTSKETYAFSSNPHKMKRFITTGIIEQSDEEKDKIINNLEIFNI